MFSSSRTASSGAGAERGGKRWAQATPGHGRAPTRTDDDADGSEIPKPEGDMGAAPRPTGVSGAWDQRVRSRSSSQIA